MAHIQIQCQNCGAKYKIPEEFKSDSAKCKQCGSTIDVASQREAPAQETPAAATPAAEGRSSRRGSRRSSRRRRGAEEKEEAAAAPKPARGAAPGRRRRGRRGAEEDEEGADEHGGRARRQRKKDHTPIIVGSIIGVLAIVATILIYTSLDKVAEKVDLPGMGDKYAEAQKRKAEEEEKERQRLLEEAKAEQARRAKEAEEKKAAAKRAKEAAAKKKIPVKVQKLEDIFDPSKLEKVKWPDSIKEDRRKELEELLAKAMANEGIHSIRAKTALERAGWEALIPITNKLLTLDFKTIKGNNDAQFLAELVQTITYWDPQVAPMTDKVEVKVAHENAIGVYQLHIKMTKRWKSADDLKDWQKKNIK